MGALIVFLAIIGILVLIGYLNFPPPYANKRYLRVFDRTVVGLCIFFCFIWIMHTRALFYGTDNSIWWTSIAAVGAAGIEIVFLGICFLLRNFWIFKPPHRPGTGLF